MNTTSNDYSEQLSEVLKSLYALTGMLSSGHRQGNLLSYSRSFMFGYRPFARVDSEEYRRYVKTINIINMLLNEYGINPKCKGRIFIADAIIIIIDRFDFGVCMNNDVYPIIAEKYGMNGEVPKIEHNIRNAIKSAYNRRDMNSKCGMSRYSARPTSKEFLLDMTYLVIEKLIEK